MGVALDSSADMSGAAPEATTDPTRSPPLSLPPFAPAGADDGDMDINPFTLAFRSPSMEGHFLGEVAKWRWPVLMFVFLFDCVCFTFRFAAKLAGKSGSISSAEGQACAQPMEVVREMGHQLANMCMLYVLIGLLNRRARRSGDAAARQEEVLLSAVMALAISNLLASLRADNASDYVYMSYFLIATTTFLKIRWWVGTGLLAAPTIAAHIWHGSPAAGAAAAGALRSLAGAAALWGAPAWLLAALAGDAGGSGSGGAGAGGAGGGPAILPLDAVVHVTVAWAVGGLMSYLSDWYRRQMYAHARLAASAHAKELLEARARVCAERELAAAQQQAAQRALSVAREKAANEAKSEFMSLMCHEVRTPLNGCLASAEMLLETPLADEQRELAKTIRVSGSILLSTVSNFLDFFKLEAGKRLDTVRSEVMLSDLVGDVHCIIEAMCGRGSAVALLPPDLSQAPAAPVLCDADRLRGVLLNLATNAAKFTRTGHICLRVREVPRDGFPAPPPGYAGITIRPCTPGSGARGDGAHDGAGGPSGAAAASASSSVDGGDPGGGLDAAEGDLSDPLAAGASRWLRARRREGRMVRECSFDGVPPYRATQEGSAAAEGRALEPIGDSSLDGGRPDGAAAVSEAATASAAIAADGWAQPEQQSHHQQRQQQQHHRHSLPDEQQQQQRPQPQQQEPPAPAARERLRARRSGGGEYSDASTKWLLFEVEDTGCGVGPEGLHGLFKEYVQGTDDDMRKPRTKGGTGLGLSICSKQVAVLGGAIGAHSRPGSGSTFWFMIPALVLRGAPGGPGGPEGQAAAGAGAAAVEQHQRLQRHQRMLHNAAAQGEGAPQADGQARPASPSPAQQQQPLKQPSPHGAPLPAGPASPEVLPGSHLLLPAKPGPCGVTAGAVSSGHGMAQRGFGGGHLVNGPSSDAHVASSIGTGGGGGVLGAAAAAASNGVGAAAHMPGQGGTSAGPEPAGSSTDNSTSSSSASSAHSLLAWPAAAPPPAAAPGAPGGAAAGRRPLEPLEVIYSSARPPASPAPQAPRAAGGAAGGAAHAHGHGAQARTPLDARRLSGLSVLLAEDNAINQLVAKKMLAALGMTVTVAGTGLEAVRAVEEATGAARAAGEGGGGASGLPPLPPCGFSVVLMDLLMPVMGGIEATRAIRAAGHSVPIVAMTANAGDRDRAECAAAGMDGFLPKPVLRDQLAGAILAVLPPEEEEEEEEGH